MALLTAMTPLTFSVHFHSPMRVTADRAAPGLDATAWRTTIDGKTVVAPATTVKGVMRAALTQSRLVADSVVVSVFGGRRRRCAWSWSSLAADSSDVPARRRTRIAIEAESGVAREDMLAVGEELLPTQGQFSVRWLPDVPLRDDERRLHRAALIVAAGLVKAVGADRRRGLGWVSVTPAEGVTEEVYGMAIDALLAGGDSA